MRADGDACGRLVEAGHLRQQRSGLVAAKAVYAAIADHEAVETLARGHEEV
jgi:hypothetical protein